MVYTKKIFIIWLKMFHPSRSTMVYIYRLACCLDKSMPLKYGNMKLKKKKEIKEERNNNIVS